MSTLRERQDKPHIAIGVYTGVWLVVNCLNFKVDDRAYVDACMFAHLRNESEGRSFT